MNVINEVFELPINKTPFIKSNVSRSSLFSIMTSDTHVGDLNAILSNCFCEVNNEYISMIEDYNKKWKSSGINIEKKGNKLKFYSSKYKEERVAYTYYNVDEKDKIVIEAEVDYLQDSNAASIIKIMCSEQENEWIEDDNEFYISISGNGKLTVHISDMNESIEVKNLNINQRISLRLEAGSRLIAQYATNDKAWIDVFNTDNTSKKIKKIGVVVRTKISPFFYDFFLSHIQLCCVKDTMVIGPHFESYESNFSSMLQIRQIPFELVSSNSKMVIMLVKQMINNGYYINLGLDEFYIEGRKAYNAYHLVHGNFIYGYDDIKRVFKSMAFEKKVIYKDIKYDDFCSAIKYKKGPMAKINLYKYDSKNYPKMLNKKMAVKMLDAYLTGKRIIALSSTKLMESDHYESLVCGLEIYNLILSNKDVLEVFLNDIRISYQIYEHNLIMNEFVEFLKQSEVIHKEAYQELSAKYKEIIKKSRIINLSILRNWIKPSKKAEPEIINMLSGLKEYEIDVCSKLIELLKY